MDALASLAQRARVDRRRAIGFVLLAVGSLLVAGLLAVLLVVARMPPFDRLVTDPTFFKRCLVVHVDLALVVWFYAFAAGLFALVPSRSIGNALGRTAFVPATVGAVLLALSAGTGGRPILANYVPQLDAPLFRIGLVVVFVAIVVTFLDPKLLPGQEVESGAYPMPRAAITALRGAGLAVLFSALTFVGAAITLPAGLPAEAHAELLVWGGGHVLQFASVCTMLACWTLLLAPILRASPIDRRHAAWLVGLLVVPPALGPLLAIGGATTSTYQRGFTRMMQFGIAPAVLVFLGLVLVRLRAHRRAHGLPLTDVRVTGFLASAVLTVAGFVLGALISGPDTRVPGHYHASIGGVTAAAMALTVPLLEVLGLPALGPRLSRLLPWQPVLLGGGQLVFAIGFSMAGAHGMRRKSYGAEQATRTLAETLGLSVMGLGGLVALVGGVLFLVCVGAMVARHVRSRLLAPEGRAWPNPTRSNA